MIVFANVGNFQFAPYYIDTCQSNSLRASQNFFLSFEMFTDYKRLQRHHIGHKSRI